MKNRYELLVIGAGPAGMAAAAEAARHGVDVALVDEQDSAGGQIYRGLGQAPANLRDILGSDYADGRLLLERFRHSGAETINNAAVWYLDPRLEPGLLVDGRSRFIACDRLILATGAQERPMPLPGWELPGVMTAGAAQILLKTSAVVPQGPVILAGSGPLLLLLATQYLRAGVTISALLDTTPKGRLAGALALLPRAMPGFDYLVKGMSMLRAIGRAGIPVYRQVEDLRAQGEDRVRSVKFRSRPPNKSAASEIELECELLLLHQGVIPDLRLPLAAGCRVRWNRRQHNWVADINKWGQSSLDRVYIAGDGADIGGARIAELEGRLCALDAAHSLGNLETMQRDREAARIEPQIKRHRAIRPLLETLYAPAAPFQLPPDDTLVCRCEEVSAGQIRAAARAGCVGPNQAKAFTRCGMGPCQGNLCGSTVASLIADETGLPIDEVGVFRVRPPLRPITFGELAGMDEREPGLN